MRALLLLSALLVAGAAAAETKVVLIVHSYGRDFAPFTAVAPGLRSELTRALQHPVAFYETSLDAERAGRPADERPFVEALRNHHGSTRPDLVVAIGSAAMNFYLRHRERLFPGVPLLVTAVDKRRLPGLKFEPRDRIVATSFDVPRIVGNILELRPRTGTLAVIMGSSSLEQLWLGELKGELAPYADRFKLVWLHGLTLTQLRERAAALPADAAMLYVFFAVDATGVPHENERALGAVHAVAAAPMFGAYDSHMGQGIVGGPLIDLHGMGIRSGQIASRMLEGGADADPSVLLVAASPAFDWRELQRWGISESRLPPGAEVRFRVPSLWEQHRLLIVIGTSIVLLQAALIAALLFQRARRQSAEKETLGLSGRLLTAHEDERRRLARELHDDLTQRLARLAIDAGKLERSAGADGTAAGMRKDLVRLSEDVHALSYRLHPSVLDDLGLVEALRAECDRVQRQGDLRVEVDVQAVPETLPKEASLCLFRVAQEALGNAARHARASAVTVLLSPSRHGLQLAVSDNGSGFDPGSSRDHASLGLASMRERVRLLQGELDIESTPGRGTTVVAWVPA